MCFARQRHPRSAVRVVGYFMVVATAACIKDVRTLLFTAVDLLYVPTGFLCVEDLLKSRRGLCEVVRMLDDECRAMVIIQIGKWGK